VSSVANCSKRKTTRDTEDTEFAQRNQIKSPMQKPITLTGSLTGNRLTAVYPASAMRLLRVFKSTFFDIRLGTFVLFIFLLSLSTGCRSQATSDTGADEAALRKLDDEWSKAAGARDVEKTISYYSDDAVVMPPNIPTLTGKEPIRSLWKSMLDSPSFSGGWKVTKVEVARSGDLAYVSGNYEFNEKDESGKPITDKGKYLEVWKKQADGSWKCVADMFNSDMPSGGVGG